MTYPNEEIDLRPAVLNGAPVTPFRSAGHLTRHQAGVTALAAMSDAEFETRLAQLRQGEQRLTRIHQELMTPGTDYGNIPGTDKPSLLKPGAEKLCKFYGLAASFAVEITHGDGHTAPVLSVLSTCRLHVGDIDGPVVASGTGAANSWERKHRYRYAERACPECGVVGSIKRSKFDDCGWYCYSKAGGCGAKFSPDAPEIVGQELGQVENPDPYDLANTLIKMAGKRAFVDATLRATATSGLYTQDVEDMDLSHEAPATGTPAETRQNGQNGRGTDKGVEPGQSARQGRHNAPSGQHDGQPAAKPTNCDVCHASMKPAQVTYSLNKFGRALCPAHQKAAGETAAAPVPNPSTPPSDSPAPVTTPMPDPDEPRQWDAESNPGGQSSLWFNRPLPADYEPNKDPFEDE